MARRDLSGAVDFAVLEHMTGGDDAVSDEVLSLFVEQAGLWSAMWIPDGPAWRDGVHTIRGAAAGIGATHLAAVCAQVEAGEAELASVGLDRVRDALDAALGDVAAYRHELMLRSLRG